MPISSLIEYEFPVSPEESPLDPCFLDSALCSAHCTVSTHTPYITTTAHRHEISLALTHNLVEFSHQHCTFPRTPLTPVPLLLVLQVPVFQFQSMFRCGQQAAADAGVARMMSTLELLWNIPHFMNESEIVIRTFVFVVQKFTLDSFFFTLYLLSSRQNISSATLCPKQSRQWVCYMHI